MASGVATMILRTAIIFVTYPVYLRFLGYEQYGVWVVLATVISFAQLGQLGIGEAVMKFVAEAYGRKDVDEAAGYVTSSMLILSVTGLTLFAVILLLKGQVVDLFNLTAENRAVAVRLLPYIAALSIYVFIVHVSTATLSGLGRMDMANYIELSGRIVSLAVSALFLWRNWGVAALALGNAVSYVLVHAASVFMAWKVAGLTPLSRAGLRFSSCKRLLRYGGGVLGITLLSMLTGPFSKVMVSRYVGVSSLAVFDIAGRTGVQIKVLFNSALRALMPEVSRLGAGQTEDSLIRIRGIGRKAAKLVLVGAGSIYVLLMLGAKPIFVLWLRQDFAAELPNTFRILLTASFVGLLAGHAYYTIMGLGLVRHGVIAHLLQAGVNVAVVVGVLYTWRSMTVSVVASGTLAGSAAASLYLLLKERKLVSELRTGDAAQAVATTG